MMKSIKLAIFVLCVGLTECTYNDMGDVSNALPIQFWPIAGKTYNEQVNGFVRAKPYTHQWQCDDPIKLQVANETDLTRTYSLKIVDRTGTVLENLPFTKTAFTVPISPALDFINNNFPTTISPWLQTVVNVGDVPWTWFAANDIFADGFLANIRGTKVLYQSRPNDTFGLGWPIGLYQFSWSFTNNNGNVDASILGSDDAVTWTTLSNTLVTTGTHGIGPFFTTTKYWKYLGIRYNQHTAGVSGVQVHTTQVELITSPVNDTPYNTFDIEFDALDISTPICNNLVQFIIQQNGVDFWKSDYHQFISIIPIDTYHGSKLLQYKNLTNFASINYPNDGNYFTLRIPCKFFTERSQTVQTSINLTGSIIDTSEFIKFQRLLQIPVIPDYILKKIELALAHSVKGSLIIDGIEWTKQEAMNRSSPGGDIKYPEQMAEIWLTDKNSGVRNII